MDEALVGGTK